MSDEIPLGGGRVTRGVVRIGDTVRRPCGPKAPFVHALLRHLEAVSFPHAPRFLGVDSAGREILSYIEGHVPADLGWFSDDQVRAAARIIRLLHDATAGTDLAGGQPVVCHGDLSPCNFVFQSGTPVCLIDFDAAFPGSRRIDIGYALWLWLDIGNPEHDPYAIGRRIATFLGEYGPDRPTDPTRAILDAQDRLLHRNAGAGGPRAEEVVPWTRRCRRWVEEHRLLIAAGLRADAP